MLSNKDSTPTSIPQPPILNGEGQPQTEIDVAKEITAEKSVVMNEGGGSQTPQCIDPVNN